MNTPREFKTGITPANTNIIAIFHTEYSNSGSLKSGAPSRDELQYLAGEIHDFWQALGRLLMLADDQLFSIDNEEQKVYEKCYKMLQKWTQASGPAANYETLARALEDEVVKRGDLACKYCYAGEDTVTPQVFQSVFLYFSIIFVRSHFRVCFLTEKCYYNEKR